MLKNLSQFGLSHAVSDIQESFKQWHICSALGRQDIKSRYRRSTLGPFWLTISMSVTVCAMGPLYSILFGVDASSFIPYLALGLIFWSYISGCLTEFGDAFFNSAHYLKQIKLPVTLFVMRVCYRQFLVLLHNFLIYPVIMVFCEKNSHIMIVLFIPAVILVTINLFWMGLIISIFCTRYRDMMSVITSLMTLMFFVTPIVWKIDQLSEKRRYIADMNPFTPLIELLRQPILGYSPSLYYWFVAALMGIVGILLSLLVLARCHHRVTYWL